MERVEEKVRIELHLQGLEFCLDEVLFQFGSVTFALAIFAVIIECLADSHDYSVDHQVVMPCLYQQRLKCVHEREAALPRSDAGTQHHVAQRKRDAAQDVRRQTFYPISRVKAKSTGKRADRDGKQREHIPVPQRKANGLFPGDIIAGFSIGNIELAGEGKAKQGPEQKSKKPSTGPVCEDSCQSHVA